jgi:isopentenyldiphosphate isomerase
LRPSDYLLEKIMADELLDVVSDDDLIIGTELRSIVHQNGLQHRGVHVFLVTPDAQLLVQLRSRHKEVFPLALDCSVSEHLKTGEDYRQAAVRGLQEELGIERAMIQELVKFKMEYGPNDFEICTLYEGRLDIQRINYEPQEVEGMFYYHLDELKEIIQKGELAISRWFVEIIKWYLGMPAELNIMEIFTQQRFLLSS